MLGPWVHIIVGTSRMYNVPIESSPGGFPPNSTILVPLYANERAREHVMCQLRDRKRIQGERYL